MRPAATGPTTVEQPQQSSGWFDAALAGAFLDLASPLRPSARLPRAVERVLPRPLESLEQRYRYVHADLADLSVYARSREAFRLRVVTALVDDPRDIPVWLVRRRELLRRSLEDVA